MFSSVRECRRHRIFTAQIMILFCAIDCGPKNPFWWRPHARKMTLNNVNNESASVLLNPGDAHFLLFSISLIDSHPEHCFYLFSTLYSSNYFIFLFFASSTLIHSQTDLTFTKVISIRYILSTNFIHQVIWVSPPLSSLLERLGYEPLLSAALLSIQGHIALAPKLYFRICLDKIFYLICNF